MAKSAFFRYLPARLKPLGKPAVWIPLTVVTVAGALAWEYYNHPEWFKSEPLTGLTPESELTSEEAARLSEIDTLDVLLNGSKAPEGTAEVTSQINPDAPVSELSSDADATNGAQSNLDNSFEAYPIPGSEAMRATSSTAATFSSTQSSLYSTRPALGGGGASASTLNPTESNRFNFGNGLVNPAAPGTNSALSEALNRRNAARAAEAGNTNAPAGTEASSASDPNNPVSGQVGASGGLPAASPVPGSFIRTTPEMSPPVGTTGYQVPATSNLPTFNIAPPQPTRNPYSAPPAATTTVPVGQPFAAPAAATPNIGGSTAPSTIPGGTLYTAPSSVQPDQGRPINPRR